MMEALAAVSDCSAQRAMRSHRKRESLLQAMDGIDAIAPAVFHDAI